MVKSHCTLHTLHTGTCQVPCCEKWRCTQVAPPHEGVELGIGDTVLFKALADAFGNTVPGVKAAYSKKGDLGQVAFDSKGKQRTMCKPKPLTLQVPPPPVLLSASLSCC